MYQAPRGCRQSCLNNALLPGNLPETSTFFKVNCNCSCVTSPVSAWHRFK